MKNNLAANTHQFLRLSGAALQMAAIIGGFTWLGNFLDNKYQNHHSLFTIILGLFGVALGLYIVIREVLSISKDK